MSIDQLQPASPQGRLAAAWAALQRAWRTANTVTHHALGALVWLAVIAYFLFCAIVLALRYLILPQIDAYKPDIERLASRALGNPVTIARIDASWRGLHPRLSLDDVVVHDQSGKGALTLPHVSATLSWWSLPALDLRLQRLAIDRPDVEVLRDVQGNFHVGGVFIDTSKADDGRGLDWLLSQHEIVIRDGRLRWKDELRGAPELPLEQVNLVLRNHWRGRHRLALKAVPPAALAAPLDVRAEFSHPRFARRIADPALWSGELYAELRDTDLTAWQAYVDYPVELSRGWGSVRTWLAFDRMRVADFTADLSLANVSTRLAKDLAPLNLVQASGRVSVRERLSHRFALKRGPFGENGHAIALTDFSLQTEDGLVLPKTTISENHVPATEGRPEQFEIRAQSLDLQTIADFAERLPLPASQRAMLADFAPRGVLKDFSAQWQGSYPAISAYRVKGQFSGLAMNPQPARPARPKDGNTPAQAAVPAIPGFQNLTGQIDASERGGGLMLGSEQLLLQLPGYFSEAAVPFDRLALQASWAFQTQDRLQLDVQKLEFTQGELSGSFSGRHLMPLHAASGKGLGTIDLTGKLNRIQIAEVGRYLPLQTPAELRNWLTGALVGGTVKDVRVRVKGDLAQFPFQAQARSEKSRGEFSVAGRIEGGRLNYAAGHLAPDGKAPLWPVIDGIDGSISFEHARMDIRAERARSAGIDLAQVKATIPDLAAHDLQLDVDGQAKGALQDFLQFTVDSPVGGWIGHFTDEIKGSGNAQLALKLQLPLTHLEGVKVRGTLQLGGNNVVLRSGMPALAGAKGKLDFHESGFSLGGVRANFLGGPVTVSGGSQRDGSILVRADGSLTAEGIRKAYAMPAAAAGAQERFAGGTRYGVAVRVKNKRTQLTVDSTLAGLALDFPAPLNKPAADAMPLHFEMNELGTSDAAVTRDEIRLSIGSSISARYEREKPVGPDGEWRVLRGGIGVNAPAPQPDSGLVANVSMHTLNLDAWSRAVSSLLSAGKEEAKGAGKEDNKSGAGLPIRQYIDPEVLAARASELVVLGKQLDNVVVGASHQDGVWQANIDSEQASGYLTWSESRSGRGLGRVTARLASLVIPKSAAEDVTELLEGKNSATTRMPAVDIVAENFELFGKKFGHLELTAQNASGVSGREWRINKLAIFNNDAELRATGRWTSKDGENLSSLAYTLNIADAGRLLDRFGFDKVLRGGKGRMQGDISWKGMPFSLDIPSLSGQLQLDIASGQFLKVDPAAAKLLGVLSLQSLPRRLALDFRDVFSEGFAFDGVTASATVSRGVARTDNFKMRGVAATVLIDGTADIAKEAQNLHVVVIPEINVGAASVVYGLAVNPVIGVGTFLAQLFLRDPLMKAFTFEYQVTGPWQDPVVTKIPRKLLDASRGAPAGNAPSGNVPSAPDAGQPHS
jgi:uncharacterized protein (TIGR02099 family)